MMRMIRNRATGIAPTLFLSGLLFGQADWTLMNPVHVPLKRTSPAMAQFGNGSSVVIFGGLNLGPTGVFNQHNVLGDTWVWNGTDWAQITSFFLTPALPAPRFGASMAYDPVSKRTVLFGGVNASGQILSDTWLFSVQTVCSSKISCNTLYSWNQVTAGASPPGRRDASFGYDPSAGIVLTGGLSSNGTNFTDTWAFIGSTNSWSRPTVINSASPARSLAPAAQCESGSTFQNAMLFGGTSGSSIPMGDTWSIAPIEGGFFVWGQFTNSTHPGSRFGHGMAYYPVSDLDVLYGGNLGFVEGIGALLASDTWNGSCNGTLPQIWSKATSVHNPGLRWLQGMTTGPSGLKLLLFGGSDQPFGGSFPNGRDRNDTWQWGRQVACLPVDGSEIPVGSEVICQFDEGFNPDAGTVFGGWTEVGFTPPSPKSSPALFHTEHPGAAAITANWTDANGAQSQTFNYTITRKH